MEGPPRRLLPWQGETRAQRARGSLRFSPRSFFPVFTRIIGLSRRPICSILEKSRSLRTSLKYQDSPSAKPAGVAAPAKLTGQSPYRAQMVHGLSEAVANAGDTDATAPPLPA